MLCKFCLLNVVQVLSFETRFLKQSLYSNFSIQGCFNVLTEVSSMSFKITFQTFLNTSTN